MWSCYISKWREVTFQLYLHYYSCVRSVSSDILVIFLCSLVHIVHFVFPPHVAVNIAVSAAHKATSTRSKWVERPNNQSDFTMKSVSCAVWCEKVCLTTAEVRRCKYSGLSVKNKWVPPPTLPHTMVPPHAGGRLWVFHQKLRHWKGFHTFTSENNFSKTVSRRLTEKGAQRSHRQSRNYKFGKRFYMFWVWSLVTIKVNTIHCWSWTGPQRTQCAHSILPQGPIKYGTNISKTTIRKWKPGKMYNFFISTWQCCAYWTGGGVVRGGAADFCYCSAHHSASSHFVSILLPAL